MFKVVTDQLKVSQGWVRCGQCAEVFDATVHLQPADGPSPIAAPAVDAGPPAVDAGPPFPAKTPPDDHAPEALQDTTPQALTASDRPEPDDAELAGAADFDPVAWKRDQDERQQNETWATYDHRPADGPDDDTSFLDLPTQPALLVKSPAADDTDGAPGRDADPQPAQDVSFVRDARRKAFWKRPLVRWALLLLALLLLGALALQWLLQQKDELAVLEPRFEPVLQALCGPLNCQIRPPRRIDSLVIDSSSFNRIGADAYRLSFTLKNTGTTLLEIPSMELTLTDTQDLAVLRRVLQPVQFAPGKSTLAGRSELVGVVSMKVSPASASPSASSSETLPPLRVAGYRILAFYP